MEIRVRTAEEIAADRMTIEVNGARLYTAAQVGDAQASEAELVAAPLRRRIEELSQSVAARDGLLRTATEERERFRAGYETAEAEASEARRKLADAERAIQILSAQLGAISGAVTGPDIQAALRTTWSDPNARAMFWAIRGIRDALGSPRSPSSPVEPTSQA